MLRLLFTIVRHVFLFAMAQNANSFPQPLEVEDEKKYLRKYKEGCKEARNILIEKNLRLVAHVVKKYSTSNIEPDDLISIGTIGLIKAITTFDTDRGARLATYAARCIENAIPPLRKVFINFCNGVSIGGYIFFAFVPNK